MRQSTSTTAVPWARKASANAGKPTLMTRTSSGRETLDGPSRSGLDSIFMEVTAYWEGSFRCRVPVRQFELRSDEPPQDGGTDTGPMPTELLLSSLAACFAMSVAYAARKQGIELPDLSVRVRGDHTGARFQRIAIEIRSSASSSELESLM